jgi:hypothetical protein
VKLRIRNNSIRLRLTQSEVKQIQELKVVKASVHFSPTSSLEYCLEPAPIHEVCARFEVNQIRILLPELLAFNWASSDQVSILVHQETGTYEPLVLLIEKDFACLKPRISYTEDESDMFPNPNFSLGHC